MHFSDIIGKLGINHIWKYFWFLHWQKLYLQPLVAAFLAIFVGQYIVWVESVNSTIFFWHVGKLMQDLCLRALILSFMESSFLSPQYFFYFFYLVYKLFKGLFQPLCQSVNFISWVFESQNIPWTCPVT